MAYKHTATSDGVYEALKDQILHLEITPGTLVSEIETSEKFNISRTPVRDAFKRLEQEHLLEIRPHVGTFVTRIDINTVADVLYTRSVVETSVLSDLAQIYDKSHNLKLNLLLQQQRSLLDSDLTVEELSRAFIKADNEFHSTLFEAAGKKNITFFMSAINSQYERFRTFINLTGKEDLEKLYESHIRILEYISNNDSDRLRDELHHHLHDGFSASSAMVSQYPEYFNDL